MKRCGSWIEMMYGGVVPWKVDRLHERDWIAFMSATSSAGE